MSGRTEKRRGSHEKKHTERKTDGCRIRLRAACTAGFLCAAVLAQGCGLGERTRTVVLPEEDGSEESWELTGIQEYAWDGGISVHSLGWSRENEKSFVYTAVREGESVYFRKIDVQYGFYENIAQLPADGPLEVWVAPDGGAAVFAADGGMTLKIYDGRSHTFEELEGSLPWGDGLLGQWSADGGSFWVQSRWDMPGIPTFCFQRERDWEPAVYESWTESGYVEKSAVSADGSYLMRMYWSEEPLVLVYGADEGEMLYGLDELNALGSEALGGDAYLALCLRAWSAYADRLIETWESGSAAEENMAGTDDGEDAGAFAHAEGTDGASPYRLAELGESGAFAVDSGQSRAVTAERAGSGYAVYLYELSGEGALSGRQLLYRGQNRIAQLSFSSDGRYVLAAEDRAATAEELGEYYESGGTRNWRAVILELS